MALSSAGIGSGLDVNGIVSQLMSLEQRPLTLLATKEAKFQAQISAYGSLKGALSTFQSAVAALATPAKFSAVKSSIGDATVAAATASSAAAPGTYSLEVKTLAQAQKLKSEPFLASSTTVGTGKLTISFGTYNVDDTFTLNPDKATKEITIAPGQGSLVAIRDAINAANAGVSAAIVNDGTGYRLTVSSGTTGLASALRITVADDDATNTDTAGLSQLAFDARPLSGVTNLTQTVEARNALVVIDGITITKPSNTITDAIEGVTLSLLKTNVAAATTLSVARDSAGIQSAVQSFVKGYNDLNKTITDLTKFDAATKKASTLTGDSTVRSLQNQLRSVFNTALPAGGGLTRLSDVGITFQTDGTLKLDAAKLTTALNDPTKDVATLFAAIAKPTDSLVTFSTATADTKNGSYALGVSQLATRGNAVGGGAAALTINAGGNDTLSVTVDGAAASITLTAGTYTAASLAAEIQAKVNGVSALSSAGISVAVTESAGVLTMTSNRYGAASIVAFTGGTAKADLFGTEVATAGVDVAGTIGGLAATGAGRILTGAGDARGLALEVTSGATGDRGSVSYARGYAYELDKLIGKMLGSDSLVDGRIGGINTSVKDIGTQRAAMMKRLEGIEKRYRAQFVALDAMMGRMQQTSNYLTQQLANLPKIES